MELFLGTKGCLQVSIGFKLIDAMKGFPINDSEIVVLGNGRFADTGRRFRMIIEWGR